MFLRFLHQHPVIAAHGPTGIDSARTISDYATPRQVRRLDLYQALYRRGVADQITSNAAGPGSITIGLAISRERWGFTERDRVILDLLHPYLGLGPARAAHAAHMRQCHRALAGDPAHHDAALIVLTRRGRIAWLTRRPARRDGSARGPLRASTSSPCSPRRRPREWREGIEPSPRLS